MRTSDNANFIIFSIFVALVCGGWRLLKKLMWDGYDKIFKEEEPEEKPKKGRRGGFKKPFFVKSLTRRRRLDLTRKHDNIVSGDLAKKVGRHRKGMFGK